MRNKILSGLIFLLSVVACQAEKADSGEMSTAVSPSPIRRAIDDSAFG